MRKLSKNNTTLTESINTNLILPTQNKTDFINSGHHEKENKDLNLSRKIEPSGTMSSSNAKMRDPKKKENKQKATKTYLYKWRFHRETHNWPWNF